MGRKKRSPGHLLLVDAAEIERSARTKRALKRHKKETKLDPACFEAGEAERAGGSFAPLVLEVPPGRWHRAAMPQNSEGKITWFLLRLYCKS